MTERNRQRLMDLRQKVLTEIDRQIELGEPGKSADGDMSVTYEIDRYGEARWTVTLYCYLIGPSRLYTWHGAFLEDALDEAENDITRWIAKEVNRDAFEDLD